MAFFDTIEFTNFWQRIEPVPRDQEGSEQIEEELRVEKWRQQREGLPLPEPRDVTIAEYGERWLRESANRLKARTLRSYTG